MHRVQQFHNAKPRFVFPGLQTDVENACLSAPDVRLSQEPRDTVSMTCLI
jgi:hypothetical protein